MSYQWSRAKDNGSEDYIGWAIGTQWRDSYDTRQDYTISAHNQPQSFAAAVLYELPFGKGKAYGNHMPFLANQILGNWEIGERGVSAEQVRPVADKGNRPLETA